MSDINGKAYDVSLLKRLFKYIRPYKKTFFATVALTILLACLAPVRPLIIQHTFDNYISTSDSSGILKMTILLISLLMVQTIFAYTNTYLTNLLGQNVIRDLRINLYNHVLNFRSKYFDNTPVGSLITRVVSDMETIADIFSEGLIVIIGDILQLVVVIGVMFYTDWRLALVSLSTLPFLFMATAAFKKGIKSTFSEVRTQVSHLNTFVQEHITGMSIVQIFNREEVEMNTFKEINRLHRKAHIRSVWYYSIFFPVVEVLSASSIGLVLWWGGHEAIASHATLGNMVAFIMYINMLFRPIRELADKMNTLQMGMVSSERVFKVLDTEDRIENKGTIEKADITGRIEFQNVWFAYNEEQRVLKDINFSVMPGQTVAMVGATGAGKSSMINILSRFYDINKGKILVDGIEIHDYKLETLRLNIGVVLQDVFLFSGSIADNISLGNPDISREEIIIAAKEVGAHEFIMRLPGNYDYDVQERGATLSVGQRQLISFIRALCKKPHSPFKTP